MALPTNGLHASERIHDISWIAAYPRSGSTWLRFLLAHVLTGRAASTTHVRDTIPDLHRLQSHDRLTQKTSNVVRTHFPFSEDHPFIERTNRTVVLIRHPLDIVVSAANFVCRQAGLDSVDVPPKIDELAALFARTDGLPLDDFWAGLGRWDENIDSWLHQNSFPAHLVRYEDLIANPEHELGAIVNFLWSDVDATAIKRAVRACRFTKMSAIELREVRARQGFIPKDMVGTPKLRFINRGLPNQWRETIQATVVARVRHRYGDTLARFGYSV